MTCSVDGCEEPAFYSVLQVCREHRLTAVREYQPPTKDRTVRGYVLGTNQRGMTIRIPAVRVIPGRR